MTAHARHIDLLLQVADIATFHDLPVPDIFHQYSGTENESTLLWVRAPDRALPKIADAPIEQFGKSIAWS